MSNGDYAEMIEIPVSTCEMVVLPKKRKKKNLRKKVVEKVNQAQLKAEENLQENFEEIGESQVVLENLPKAKKFSFDVIAAQVVAIFVLVIVIMVTNIFWEDSGINNLVKGALSQNQNEIADERVYSEFTAICPSKVAEVEVLQGVMKIDGEGAIYSPCEGKVENVEEIDGKFTLTIGHSDVFKTVIRGADYAYFSVGETVYQAVPVCFSKGGAEVMMYDNNSLLSTFTIADGLVVWQS